MEVVTAGEARDFDLIGRKRPLRPGDRPVEGGRGWDDRSMLAAEKYRANVTGHSLVAAHNDTLREIMASRGLQGRVALVEKDHRQLADEPAACDRFVAVGLHVHAGCDRNGRWIASSACALRPGGVGLIPATFIMLKRPTNCATLKHIFPGGCIPSLVKTLILMEQHGLNAQATDKRAAHGHRTAQAGLLRLETRWDRIRSLAPAHFDEKFCSSGLSCLGGTAENFEVAREIIHCHHAAFTTGHFADPGAMPRPERWRIAGCRRRHKARPSMRRETD